MKFNAVRVIGTILYLFPQKYILSDTTLGLDALIKYAVLGNDMKIEKNCDNFLCNLNVLFYIYII